MSELGQAPRNEFYPQATKQPRRDFLTAQLIEVGIAIQMLDGTHAAAEYLKSRDIDIRLATRALTQPLNRRSWCDWNYRVQPDDHF